IRQREAASFKPIGSPVKLPKGLVGGVFDDKGRFWLGSPGTGKVISIKPGKKGPRVDQKISIRHEKRPWVMGTLDSGVAVLDPSNPELTVVNGHGAVSKTTIPPITTAIMPERIRGDVIPITDPVNRKVIVIRGEGIPDGSVAKQAAVHVLSITGAGQRLGTATAFSGRLYLSDEDAGLVRVIDLEGKDLEDFSTGGGPVEIEDREDHLMINSQDTDRAWVVDARHQITGLRKNPEAETAGSPSGTAPTPAATAPSPSHPGPKPPSSPPKAGPPAGPKPPVNRPAAPDAPVIARVLGNSDGSVTVEWYAPNAHGGTLQSYDVRATTNAPGGNRTFSGISHVSGSSLQRMQIEPRALVQGASYTFTVVARSTNGAVSAPSSPSGITRTQP
ncbi:MAG: fibronectin type III domain-containing protein, partial [Mycobacteriales bacterium]